MKWRYAASPINWCNDDLLDLGDQYQLTDILADMQALGMEGTELGRKFPRRASDLRPLLERYGLRLASGWATVHLADPAGQAASLEAYARHVAFLAEMGATVAVTAEGSGSVHWDVGGDRRAVVPWSQAEWQAVLAGLQRAGEIARRHGVRLVYHPHLGTNIEGPEAIARLLENTDPDLVGLVLDTGHIFAGGGDSAAVVRQYRGRIAHVHLKDVRPPVLERYRRGELGFLEAVRAGIFTVPGDGAIDFGPVLTALAQQDYDGWCVIEAEQDPARADPVRYMQRALRYLGEWAAGQR